MSAVENVFLWMAQTILLASVAALLPVLFRVTHPRAQIAYCHLVLIVCLLIPWIEPWRHPRIILAPAPAAHAQIVLENPAERAKEPAPVAPGDRVTMPAMQTLSLRPLRLPPWNDNRIALWILAAGVVARLCWLLGGLWQTRKYRISSLPLYPIPDSVRAASAVVHSDALFCISPDVPGPVMLGWLAPVVLLPESFLQLGEEAQCGIACHELLHVRRGDWLVTICEEVVAALMWFNPGAWALLAQARLAREQHVDGEAVRLTGSRESYIDALLAMARRQHSVDLAPAPVFLRRRHLTRRMHSLLNEVSMSRFRLWSSYGSISAILVFAAWSACLLFPLTGAPQAVAAPTDVTPAAAVSTPVPPFQLPPAFPPKPEPRRATQPKSAKEEPAERLVLAYQQPQPRVRFAEGPVRTASVPLVPDAYEPVTGSIQNASDPADRGAALALLERARQHGISHRPGTPPYKLEVNFNATGSGVYTGTGQLTETWLSGAKWLWTASLGSYSVSRTLGFGSGTGEKYPGVIAMPIHILRNALFWAVTPLPEFQVRTAAVQWKSRPVTCILMSGMVAPAEQNRLWEETEYCIDNASGLLQVQSIAPGTYTVFNYDRNLQFHGRSTPDRITIYSNGKQVLDAQVGLVDAGPADESQLRPTEEMRAAGPITTTAMWNKMAVDVPMTAVIGLARPVIIHASVDGKGNVVEEELSQASDAALAQQALDLVKGSNLGATGTQRQVYVNVRYIPATR